MHRHVRGRCKANTEENIEKIDYTVRHQLEVQQRQLADQNAKIDRLTALLEKQQRVASLVSCDPEQSAITNEKATGAGGSTVAITTNSHNVTNTSVVQVHNQITIRPWDGENRITVPVSLIAAAFAENPRLAEYCRLDDEARTDAKTASPYVTEALADLVRRAHADPEARNVYLSRQRADQVLVHLKAGTWEVRPLEEATRLLFDGVATGIHRAILTDAERVQLPTDVQSAAAWVPIMYEDDPEEYVKRAKAPMVAHLANTRQALEGK